jgi:osmotically-inducible protein OsmY
MEAHSPVVRTDADITADIETIIQAYPPLVHDRGHLQVAVQNNTVTLGGHVRSLNTHEYLLEAVRKVEGVSSLDATYLHVDETMRLSIGQVIPVGVIANVEYGTVILSGRLTTDLSIDELAARVGSVPGVRRVVIALRN